MMTACVFVAILSLVAMVVVLPLSNLELLMISALKCGVFGLAVVHFTFEEQTDEKKEALIILKIFACTALVLTFGLF